MILLLVNHTNLIIDRRPPEEPAGNDVSMRRNDGPGQLGHSQPNPKSPIKPPAGPDAAGRSTARVRDPI